MTTRPDPDPTRVDIDRMARQVLSDAQDLVAAASLATEMDQDVRELTDAGFGADDFTKRQVAKLQQKDQTVRLTLAAMIGTMARLREVAGL